MDRTFADRSGVPVEIIYILVLALTIQYYIQLKRELVDATDADVRIIIMKQLVSVIGGLYLSDLFSGTVHIALDHLLDDSSIELVRYAVDAFNTHHTAPSKIIDTSVQSLYEQTAVFFPLPIGIAILQQYTDQPSHAILANIIFMVVSSSSQFIHREAHNYNHHKGDGTVRTRVYGILSGLGLVMDSEYHRIHHATEGNGIHFPIVNGWSSPFMDWVVRVSGILD